MIRNLFLSALSFLLFFGVASANIGDDKDKEVKIKTSAICEMCKARIEKNLTYEKGVQQADLDLNTKVVTIRYNAKKTDVAKLKANISKSGYDADEVLADEAGYNKLPSCCKKTAAAHP